MAELNLNEIQDILGGDPTLPPTLPPTNQELSVDDLQGLMIDAPEGQVEPQGVLATIRDFVTGESRTTSTIEEVPEIGMAPELNEFSLNALKASAGLLFTGDDQKASDIIKSQIPEAAFRTDEKGNVLVDLPSGSYALNKPGLSGQDIARGLFQFAAFTPAGRMAAGQAGTLGRIGVAGAASGATEAGLQAGAVATGAEDVSGEDIVLSTALGTGGQLLGELVSAGTRAAKGSIGAREQQIIEAGERAGVPVMTTDVIPPKGIVGGLARQLGERIPIFGTGGKRAIQSEAREKAVNEFVSQFPENTSQEVFDSLKAQTSKVKKAAGGRINSVVDDLTPMGDVPRDNLLAQVDTAVDRLSAVKIEPDTETISALQRIKEAAKEPHNFSELREARTRVRELASATDPLGKSQLPSKSKAALEQVRLSITKDLDAFVIENLGSRQFGRYKEADAVYQSEAKKLTKSRLKNILDKGDLTPETVENMIFSRKPSEVKLLHDSLDAQGKVAARAALVQRALLKAQRGDDISPNIFAKQLDDMKISANIFFKGKDKKALKGMQKLLQATKQAQDAGVVTPTGQSLFGLTAVGAGSQVGFLQTLIASATSGGAARLYESPPVRNFLLRLADTPINSAGFDRLIRTSTPKINAAMQATQQEGSK
jgi:hypothetical protein